MSDPIRERLLAAIVTATGGEYGDSKIDAEKLCFEYLAKGVPITILRPSIIYGPFSNTWVVRTAQRLQSGNWGVFDKYGNGICNLIYVDDLVSDQSARSRGAGRRMLAWLEDKSRTLACGVLALDSGVQRHAAHRFYFREGMHIASFCFRKALK